VPEAVIKQVTGGEPRPGRIVIAAVDGELTVKRPRVKEGRLYLAPENLPTPSRSVSRGILRDLGCRDLRHPPDLKNAATPDAGPCGLQLLLRIGRRGAVRTPSRPAGARYLGKRHHPCGAPKGWLTIPPLLINICPYKNCIVEIMRNQILWKQKKYQVCLNLLKK